MNYGRVAHILGTFCCFISGMLLLPLFVAYLHGEADAYRAFGIPIAVGLVGGFILRRVFKDASRNLYRREGLLIVTGCWLAAAILGAVPFVLSGMIPNLEDAFFESMSGFTTTGSTILREIETQGRGLMFWRSMTHWLGGMGIVVLFVAVLPALGVGGRLLYQFEAPGVETDDLKPRIRETALALWKIYLVMTVAETSLLMVAGLDLYDAVVHTFGTVATGGFSTYSGSISHFDSAAVEIIITVFMFLAGVNFTLYFRARRDGLRHFIKDPEFKTYAGIMGVMIVITVAMLLSRGGYDDGGRAALDAAFTVVSVGTTTGYGTVDFETWPTVLRIMLVMLMFIGGSAGSTAGGMKVFRIMLVVKYVGHEFRRFIRPHRVRTMLVGGHEVSDEVMRNVLAFFAVSILLFAGSTVALAAMDPDIQMETATTSVVATLWNIGPGLGAVGPTDNFADLPGPGKILLTFLMLFGRLEVFTAMVIFMPGLYRD
ncbi:MAG: potassium transporter [Planctomycetes bacterium]|nr:potassium transporter [Planctomycetota bacterium]